MENLKKPLARVGHLVADEPAYSTEHDECIMCNKAIRGESKYMIHACNGAIDEICSNTDHDYVEENDAGDMGFWSVGSTCVKKLQSDLRSQGLNPSDYIYTKTKKAKTKSWSITEEDTLVLWRALEMYMQKGDDADYDKASLLLAKVIHKSCSFSGTLEKGETVKSIYKSMD